MKAILNGTNVTILAFIATELGARVVYVNADEEVPLIREYALRNHADGEPHFVLGELVSPEVKEPKKKNR